MNLINVYDKYVYVKWYGWEKDLINNYWCVLVRINVILRLKKSIIMNWVYIEKVLK